VNPLHFADKLGWVVALVVVEKYLYGVIGTEPMSLLFLSRETIWIRNTESYNLYVLNRTMLCRARLCRSMSSVCLSVRFRYCDHIGWNTSIIISRPNSLRLLLGLTPTSWRHDQVGPHPLPNRTESINFSEGDLIIDDSSSTSCCSQILLTVDLQRHVFPFGMLFIKYPSLSVNGIFDDVRYDVIST